VRLCGVDLTAVREIIPPRAPTRLPGAPPAVLGIINVRGSIVTLVHLGCLIGVSDDDAVGSLVLVEHGSRMVALAVKEVLDVHRVSLDRLQSASESGLRVDGIQAVVEDGDQVIVLLDVDALIRQVLLFQSEER
jgi:chemotaxis signal transduction protein